MPRSKEVYKIIRDEIVKGILSPGERLIENDLVNRLGLSRGPIREAFRYLEKDGYVQITPNKGAVVTKVDAQEVRDYYAILAVVESKAVEWSYPNLEEADLRELVSINEALRYWTQNGLKVDVIKWHEINLTFHNFFGSKCGNAKLCQTITDLRKRLFRLRYWSILTETYDDYMREHDDIISHLLKGDSFHAQEAMEKHIMKVCDNHLGVITAYDIDVKQRLTAAS